MSADASAGDHGMTLGSVDSKGFSIVADRGISCPDSRALRRSREAGQFLGVLLGTSGAANLSGYRWFGATPASA